MWWRGGGWRGVGFGLAAGALIGGIIAASTYRYGYGYPAYSYGYGYPAYSYGYGYPGLQLWLRLSRLQLWLRLRPATVIGIAMRPLTIVMHTPGIEPVFMYGGLGAAGEP